MDYERAYNDLCKLIWHLDAIATNEMVAISMMSDSMYEGVGDVKFADASGRMTLTNELRAFINHQKEEA